MTASDARACGRIGGGGGGVEERLKVTYSKQGMVKLNCQKSAITE